jgi:hypothetical protein
MNSFMATIKGRRGNCRLVLSVKDEEGKKLLNCDFPRNAFEIGALRRRWRFCGVDL